MLYNKGCNVKILIFPTLKKLTKSYLYAKKKGIKKDRKTRINKN